MSAADKEVLVQGERFQYFGNFIIVRRANNAFKRIINQLNSLGLSFDGTTVQIVTRTQPDILGPGVLYIHQSAGVTFYTNNYNLIQRISDALSNPGGLPTPPPEEGKASTYWNSCLMNNACTYPLQKQAINDPKKHLAYLTILSDILALPCTEVKLATIIGSNTERPAAGSV